jgi:hypothetical protein
VLAGGEYERGWADLRRRDQLIRLVALSSLPVVAILILFTSCIYGDAPEHFGRWVSGRWLAAFFSACVYRRKFRCPRCRYSFLSEVRFTAGACAVVVASPFGAVVGLRSRRCGNRSIESRARRLDQTPGVNAPLGDQTATRRWWTARRHREHRESGRSGG